MPGPWGQWHPLLLSDQKASGAATNEDLDLGPVPVGQQWCINHVAAEDETTAATEIRFGIARAGTFFPLEDQESPAAGVLYTVPDPIYLAAGEYLRVRFVGSTNNDVLKAYANGYAIPAPPGA